MPSLGTWVAEFKATVDGFTKPIGDAQGALAGFQAKIGAAGPMLTGIGASVSALGAPFALAAKSAIDTADTFSVMSEKVGVSVESLSALAHAFSMSGSSAEAMEAGLKKLSNTAFDAANGSKAAETAFAALGVSVVGADGALRASDEILLDVANKFAVMPDGVAKTALAMDIFGKSGADLLPVLNQGAAGITALTDEARSLGLVISTDTATAANNFNDALDKLTSSFTGVFNSIVSTGLLDHLASFASRVADIIAWLAQSNPLLITAAAVVGGLAIAIGPLVLAAGALSFAIGAISTPVLAVFGAGGALVVAIAAIGAFASKNEEFGQFLTDTWGAISEGIGEILEELTGIFEEVAAVMLGIWEVLGDDLIEEFKITWNLIRGIIGPALEGIKGILSGALSILKGTIQIFSGWLAGDFTKTAEGVKNIWQGLWTAIKAIILAPIDAIKNTVTGFTNTISGSFKTMYDKVVGNSYVPDMMKGIEAEFGKLGAIMDNPTKAAKDAVLGSFGGMFEGVLGQAGQWKDKLTGIFDNVKNIIKDPLGSLGGMIGLGGGGGSSPGIPSGGGSAIGSAGGMGSAVVGGLVSGGISALGSFLGNMRLEGTMNAVEYNTRATAIQLKDTMEQILWPIKGYTEWIAGFEGRIGSHILPAIEYHSERIGDRVTQAIQRAVDDIVATLREGLTVELSDRALADAVTRAVSNSSSRAIASGVRP